MPISFKRFSGVREKIDQIVDGTVELLSRHGAGAMSAEQFDGAIYDLVNFLAYTAEPFKADRQRIGTYVLLFLVVFFIFAWLLNREYWKDVH